MVLDQSFAARRLNHILSKGGGSRYLEIGVSKGTTFLAVNAANKVAVDPTFQFDWKSQQTETVRLHQCTSDDYFTKHADGEPFDLMFIDGLHTFEQTFRDFCSSLSLAHRSTVWIIDDILPSDVYSAMPDWQDTFRFRKEVGLTSSAWHGDTFKIMFAIHDFFPTLSYCSIKTGGNPQALVWTQPRRDFKPRYNCLEKISRLTFFDLQKNIDVLRLLPEAEALEMVTKQLWPTGGVKA